MKPKGKDGGPGSGPRPGGGGKKAATPGSKQDHHNEAIYWYEYAIKAPPGPHRDRAMERYYHHAKEAGWGSKSKDSRPNGKHALAGDSKERMMPQVRLSPQATVAKGALMIYLAPRMAMDASVDLNRTLRGVNRKNFKSQAKRVASDIKTQLKGKLAQDADVDDLADVLEELGEMLEAEAPGETNNNKEMNNTEDEDDDAMMDGYDNDMPGVIAKVKEFLTGKLADEDMQELDRILSAEEPDGEDEDPDNTEEENKKDDEDEMMNARDRKARDSRRAHDEPPPFKGRPNPGGTMDKKAMDSAIANAIQNQKDIAAAERFCTPWVGSFAMDSATSPEDVYGHALKMRGVDIKGVHPSAFKRLLEMTPRPGSQKNTNGSGGRFAHDSAVPTGTPSYGERFKNATRIQRM